MVADGAAFEVDSAEKVGSVVYPNGTALPGGPPADDVRDALFAVALPETEAARDQVSCGSVLAMQCFRLVCAHVCVIHCMGVCSVVYTAMLSHVHNSRLSRSFKVRIYAVALAAQTVAHVAGLADTGRVWCQYARTACRRRGVPRHNATLHTSACLSLYLQRCW
jgi:hypothetical protein